MSTRLGTCLQSLTPSCPLQPPSLNIHPINHLYVLICASPRYTSSLTPLHSYHHNPGYFPLRLTTASSVVDLALNHPL
ncbi:unnamed protein product, partial [Gulo gulo]